MNASDGRYPETLMPLHDGLTCVAIHELDAEQVGQTYEGLLRPAFRDEELLTRDELRAAYGQGATAPSAVILRDHTPVAVMLAEWYQARRVMLLAYLAVATEERGSRLGAFLLTEILPTWGVAGSPLILAEVDDPGIWRGSALSGDPEARLRFYARHGATLVPLPYFQPSLRSGSDRVHGMLLLRLDRDATHATDTLRRFLTEYFIACEGPRVVDDGQVEALLANADRLDINTGTWPVDRWPEIRGADAGVSAGVSGRAT
jgi:hypothetical protein